MDYTPLFIFANVILNQSKMEKTAKKIGWLGITLCGLCCALPIIGAVVGISSLTAIAFYLEKIGIVALGLAGIFFAYYFYQKNQAKKPVQPHAKQIVIVKKKIP